MNCIRSERRVPSCECVRLAALEEILTNEEIETICRQQGHTWRDRVFSPAVTVRSMVYRGLHPDKSIKGILADMAATREGLGSAPSDAAWCQARSRLPKGLWPALIEQSADRVTDAAGDQFLFVGHPVHLVDGSTLSMPDTPKLVEAFGYANTKHGPSRFPVARITFIVRAGVEAVCHYRLGPYSDGENAQLHAMWHAIPCGSIAIWDRHFCSFYNLAKCLQREVHVIARLHQRRDPEKLIANGKQIGKNEWHVTLDLAPQLREQYKDPTLPQCLCVRLIRGVFYRGGRCREIWLLTTLLDPKRYRRSRIVRLYRHMLACIASDPNPHRPGRVEPRLIKRDPVRYEFLKIPRDKARLFCLS